ncbi:DUF4197 domain-containing protein [Nisaea nitritireducens]|uniref:DUF4197 domain-containing protein n=1 Tax=Nisaea nitritireducens TaxID=568392 RepID=UPI001866DAEA|nr:DUF4197 domain-containing protein [Nisaea nitritireducens]
MIERLYSRRGFLGASVLFGATVTVGTARAQTDLFGTAKGLLNSLGGSGQAGSGLAGLDNETIFAGLKEALSVGTEKIVSQLSAANGYFGDSAVHIPLPESLQTARKFLDKAGFGSLADDLELRMNRAAEAAAPEAGAIFSDAISSMSLEDVKAIYEGPDDSATRWFQQRTGDKLTERFTPVVEASMSEVGVVQSYDAFVGQYAKIPFVPDAKAELSTHVVGKALDGLFHYLAIEEKAIRTDPVARSTDLLKKVFGS